MQHQQTHKLIGFTSRPEIRVLVCGGGGFCNEEKFGWMWDQYIRNVATLIIQGGSSGADAMAKRFAERDDIECITVDAGWHLGNGAGPVRNATMLEKWKPHYCVALPGGRGTGDMKARCGAAGVPVLEG